MERLKTLATTSIPRELATELGRTNLTAVPAITKVFVNCGLGHERTDQKKTEQLTHVLALVTGQRPVLRRARQSVASFKIRSGEPVALSLTLRGQRMYDFLERLIRIALPRVRDFRGINRKQFDGHGNLTIGILELAVFPEIRPEEFDITHGCEVTIVTSATNDSDGEALLKRYNIPFTE